MARGVPGSGPQADSESGVQFFTKIDTDPITGKVASEYPAWYFTNQLERLKEDLSQITRRLESGEVPQANVPYYKSQERKLKARLDQIVSGTPKLTAPQKDSLASGLKDLGAEIAASMPSDSDMRRGTVDAHTEARCASTPCIRLPDVLVRMMNMDTDKKGMVSRNDAQRAWKIGMKCLGESSHTENLRRE
jgi:hypothetical protein